MQPVMPTSRPLEDRSHPLVDVWHRLGCGRHAGPCPVPALPGAALAASGQSARPAASPHHIPKTRAFEPSTSCSRSQGPAGMHSQQSLAPCLAGRHHAPPRRLLRLVLHHAVPYYSFTYPLLTPPLPPGTSRLDRYRRSPYRHNRSHELSDSLLHHYDHAPHLFFLLLLLLLLRPRSAGISPPHLHFLHLTTASNKPSGTANLLDPSPSPCAASRTALCCPPTRLHALDTSTCTCPLAGKSPN